MLSSNRAVIYSCRPGGDYGATFISQNVEQLVGYQPQDFIDIPDFWRSHIHPDDVESVLANLTHLFADGFHKDEYRFLHNDGHYVWIRDELRLVYDDAGELLEIIGYFADVSDLKNVEAALRESEDRWQFALEGAGDGIWDWNRTENTVFYSLPWKKMLGYEDHEIQNHFSEWEKRLHPDDKQKIFKLVDDYLINSTSIYQNEHRIRCKDGSYKWILARGKTISWTKNGEPSRIIGTHTDITERKQVEQSLRKSELHLKTAQRISQIGSWEFDVSLGQITWSAEVFHIFGVSESDGPPSFETLTLIIHPEDRDRHRQTVEMAIKQGQAYDIEYRIYRNDGELAYIQARGEVLKDGQGNAGN